MTSPKLSIISPVFCAACIVPELVQLLMEGAREVTEDFEIILVDDASRDDSWARVACAALDDSRVRAIRLTRNFGQHKAIAAGIQNASGDLIIVIDCDLQDDPTYIKDLVRRATEGFDVVLTKRTTRNHPRHRNILARLFFIVFNLLTDHHPADANIGSYSLMSRKAVNAYLRIGDVNRHHLLVLSWLGFRSCVIAVEHRSRRSGTSSYTLPKLIGHAIQGITSNSTRLLKISVVVGFAYVGMAIVGMIYLVASYYLHGFRAGWASTIVLILGSTGFILTAIGILGIYIGHIFEQVRERPLYLIQEHINFERAPK
jgi:glycosyltransferase involved in cell wall biosynthesis